LGLKDDYPEIPVLPAHERPEKTVHSRERPFRRKEHAMTAFTVWKFEDPDGAGQAATVLKHADAEGHEETWHGTGWGAFWGLLIGALFFVPVIGGVAGAAIGAISKATEGTGITKEQLEKIRTQVTEGTSALFVVSEQGDLDRLGERFHRMHSKLIDTNLTDAEREELLQTFGGA
jgi:uncharacterized membrane protein